MAHGWGRVTSGIAHFARLARHYPRAAALVWQSAPAAVLSSALWVLVLGVVPPVQLWLMKLLVDGVSLWVPAASALSLGAAAPVVGAFVALACVWVAQNLALALDERSRSTVSRCAAAHARLLLLRKAASLDVAFYDDPAHFDLMSNAMQQERASRLTYSVSGWLRTLLQLVGSLVLLSGLHALAPAVMLLVVLPEAVVAGSASRMAHALWTTRAPDRRMAEYVSGLLASREAAMEIRAFGLQDTLLERFSLCWGRIMGDERQVESLRARGLFAASLLAAVGAATVGGYAVYGALQGVVTVGDLTMYLGAATAVWRGADLLLRSGAVAYENSLFLESMFSFLDMDEAELEGCLDRADHLAQQQQVPCPIRHGIEFREVGFQYPGTESYALRNVSFRVPPGDTVAIVGPNGAGKTTVVKLLCRLYDPTEGDVLMDGVPLRRYDLSALRSQFSIICQDFVRYPLSVADNVGFGDPRNAHDPVRLDSAALRAGVTELIQGLPQGWDTCLGRIFPGGVELSTGQWQRIALARAFMRDAQVQVLDEPTASLDALAEHDLFSRFADLAGRRTCVLISHRFSTVKMADLIVVLDGGRVVEQGSHGELMALRGLYASMFRAQADRYGASEPPGPAATRHPAQ